MSSISLKYAEHKSFLWTVYTMQTLRLTSQFMTVRIQVTLQLSHLVIIKMYKNYKNLKLKASRDKCSAVAEMGDH